MDLPNLDGAGIEDLSSLLAPVMTGVATAVGPHCEVVLHDLSGDVESTVIAIENGHVTGRSVGSPSTSKGLQFKRNAAFGTDEFGYRGTTRDGRELRCSSIFIRDAAGHLLANLCINVDQTPLINAKAAIDAMIPTPRRADSEVFATDVNELLDALFDHGIAAIGKVPTQLTKEERIVLLKDLDSRGVFFVKNAASTIAARLGISRGALYSYLDQGRAGERPVTGGE
ncbi:helix-turn-helix transcriptional regulator [Tsukamurella soli]